MVDTNTLYNGIPRRTIPLEHLYLESTGFYQFSNAFDTRRSTSSGVSVYWKSDGQTKSHHLRQSPFLISVDPVQHSPFLPSFSVLRWLYSTAKTIHPELSGIQLEVHVVVFLMIIVERKDNKDIPSHRQYELLRLTIYHMSSKSRKNLCLSWSLGKTSVHHCRHRYTIPLLKT
ncbi:hypothetical protein MJO28_016090 [Puccinia striiformis f. sp. tritici]|uniref:Uncharacterized protein n=1 Tax=Puccinia striiformis f. sp. tritici TaxID=168172 RepID=A0ACC0DSI6_9BASI|nr:hypothetical protein MJO28_016090 [Puccinia striiformis f. sp. tritici]